MKNKDNDDNSLIDSKMSRRHMLESLVGLTAGAFSSTLMPANVRKVLAHPTVRGNSLKDIEHVVLLMQENRSFDHYFGSLSEVRGFDDPHAMKLEDGQSVFHQPDPQNPEGYLLPFHLNTRKTNAQKIPSTSHAWSVQHAAWNHGKMDNWIPAHRKPNGPNAPYVMSYYRREDLPFHYALADAFTICDNYHCSVLGPTVPNKLYWLSGTIDPEGNRGGPRIDNYAPKEGYQWTTYAERLEKAAISWKVYQDKQRSYNPLKKFKAFKNAAKDSPLYKKGMARGPVGQFEYDAINDNLPAVSWIMPNHDKGGHPPFMPAAEASGIASKINAVAANPDVWAKTVFILNWDENDGLFDHVAPPVPQAGTAGEFVKDQPIGAGFRVPCMIISPWTTGGWIAHEPFDHTSTLQFLEKFTGVREPNISPWRRETFGDLTSVFRFSDKAGHPPELPPTGALLNRAKYEANYLPKPDLPGANQKKPHQEKGARKHLPKANGTHA